jgi:ABC-type Mn2+/Zn2+ transport system permease subunit
MTKFNMLQILHYTFFQNALIWWILIAFISSILWVFIVMRKEANVTHSISNFLFLWIAVSLLLHWNYYLFAFLFWIIWSLLIFFIEKTHFITKESSKEIISQAWIAGGIFCISFLNNLTLDINNFLFWSILFVNKTDIIILSCLFIICYILFFAFSKNFLSVIINEDMAKSKWIKTNIYNLWFLVFLSIFIWISIKIFWIMLIWAFLIIPANTAKVLSKSIKSVFIISGILSVFSVIFWLFLSYFLWASSGATIVLILIFLFFLSLIWKKIN